MIAFLLFVTVKSRDSAKSMDMGLKAVTSVTMLHDDAVVPVNILELNTTN